MKRISRLGTVMLYLILIVLSVVFLYPILVTVTNSFMSPFEITNRYTINITAANSFQNNGNIHFVEMVLIPSLVTIKQYIAFLFGTPEYLGFFWNSVIITAPVVIGQVLTSLPAAYAFEHSRFKYKEAVFFIYIVVMLMPLQVVLVPNYLVAKSLNIHENYLAIILPGIISPFGVFLIRQYLKGMPIEYIDAAQIDGCGHFSIIFYIILPFLKSAVAALAMLTFIEYWNLVDQAVIFISDSVREPLSVYLSKIAGDKMDIFFAVACFYMLPAVLIFLYGYENMVEGIQLSGLK